MVKAAVMWGFNEPLRIDSVKLKAPREDEVVVKVVASGVCHSDLSVVKMVLPIPPPLVLGHEGAGIVEEVGSAVQNVRPGDHVVMSWVENCGRCLYCTAGDSHLCDTGVRNAMAGKEAVFEKDGVDIARMAGVASFAERTIVRATACVKIAEEIPLDRACLVGCAVMTGVGAAVNTAKVRPGETVAVFGCGGVGLNVVQGAALCGASRIIAVDLADAKLELAREFGATDLVNGKETDAVDAVKSLTGGRGVDYAFEVIGVPAVIQQAFATLKRGGKAVIVGVPRMGEEVGFQGWSFPLEGKSIIGSLYGSASVHRDMPRLLELYQQKRLKLDELISRRIPLEAVNDAFAAMEKGEVARSVIVY
ncbi:MAG: Zn-dependent alcohol dehydrogenase [Deltaproteobacteria bacterium]|nr:Zn-dependent alcohol dehydrogenase [Deltaproteobacteria bacterium]